MRKTLDEQLKERYARWEHLYKYGGQDPNWPDGVNLNLVRNHIINIKKQMKEAGELTDTYYRDTPPRVDNDYMARADEIRAKAKKSLEIYKKHPDYLYLIKIINRLDKQHIEKTCINYVIGYVTRLEKYINDDDLVAMRRHKYPERYIDSFTSCRKRVEKILSDKQEIVFIKDKKQIQGQISIFDLLIV